MTDNYQETGQIRYFWYSNEEKIDSLFSQINGRLETERTEETSKARGGKVSASAEVGGILAALGIGKFTAAGEGTTSASKMLSVTATLSPANKVVVLIEYLQRVGQLAVVPVNDIDEKGVLNEIAGRPFQVLNGTFDMKQVDAKRDILRSERRNGAGRPMIQVPLLDQNAGGQFRMAEEEYVANGVFAQILVQPGRFVASPIAVWYAMMSPLDAAATYWTPTSESLPQHAELDLVPPVTDTTE